MYVPRVYTNDGVMIARVMKDLLNSWQKKPVEIQLNDIGTRVPGMMLQQLAAAEKKKAYVNGSYIGEWNFAVYMRVRNIDTASRLDAISCLTELAEWLTEQNSEGVYLHLPVIDDDRTAVGITLSSTPSIAARYENGTEDYQVLMALEYIVKRRS